MPRYPVAWFPNASLTVTTKNPDTPAAIAVGNPATLMVLAAPGLTVIPVCDPVTEEVTVSVAVTLKVTRLLAALSAPLNECTPASPEVYV